MSVNYVWVLTTDVTSYCGKTLCGGATVHLSKNAAMSYANELWRKLDPEPHLSPIGNFNPDTFNAWIERQLPGDDDPGYAYEMYWGRPGEDDLDWGEQ